MKSEKMRLHKRLLNFIHKLNESITIKRIPARLVFIIIGFLSTIWFLVRVIPKPSRATYPCMKE